MLSGKGVTLALSNLEPHAVPSLVQRHFESLFAMVLVGTIILLAVCNIILMDYLLIDGSVPIAAGAIPVYLARIGPSCERTGKHN